MKPFEALLHFETAVWQEYRDTQKPDPNLMKVGLGLAKIWTMASSKVYLKIRCKGFCEWCGASLRNLVVDPHHIFPKGTHQGVYLDHPGNMLFVSRKCHNYLHANPKIMKELQEKALEESLPPWFLSVMKKGPVEEGGEVIWVESTEKVKGACVICKKKIRNKTRAVKRENGGGLICGICKKRGSHG